MNFFCLTRGMLRAGRSGVQIPVWARYFLFLKKSRKAPGHTQLPIKQVPGLFPGGKAAGIRRWPQTSVDAPILWMKGAPPLLPLDSFTAWTRTTLLLPRVLHIPPIWYDNYFNYWRTVLITKLLAIHFYPFSFSFIPLFPNVPFRALDSQILGPCCPHYTPL